MAGTYNFRIDLSDTKSDVTNNSVTFQVKIQIMDATSISMLTTPADQVYTINQATLLVDPPTYSWFPTQSATSFSYTIVSGPAFVTVGGSP